MIGKEAKIYEVDKNKFLISIGENELDNSYVLVRVDKNLLQKAKQFGIDISSFLEEKIEDLILRADGMRPPGFEPGQRAREARVLPLDYDRLYAHSQLSK